MLDHFGCECVCVCEAHAWIAWTGQAPCAALQPGHVLPSGVGGGQRLRGNKVADGAEGVVALASVGTAAGITHRRRAGQLRERCGESCGRTCLGDAPGVAGLLGRRLQVARGEVKRKRVA